MQEIILSSGNKLGIQTPKFGLCQELIRAACRELKKDGLHFDITTMKEGEALSIFLSLMGSKELDDCFWAIANTCLYNGERVLPNLFDDREEAREDYFEIQLEIIRACLKPFGKSLPIMLKNLGVME